MKRAEYNLVVQFDQHFLSPCRHTMSGFDQAEYAQSPTGTIGLDLGQNDPLGTTLDARFPSQASMKFWRVVQPNDENQMRTVHVQEQFVVGAMHPGHLRYWIWEIEQVLRAIAGLCSEIEITITGGPAPLPEGAEFPPGLRKVNWGLCSPLDYFPEMSLYVGAVMVRYMSFGDSPVRMPVIFMRKSGGRDRHAGPICWVRGAAAFKPASRLACHQRYTLSSEGVSCIKALLLVFQRMRGRKIVSVPNLPAELVNIVIKMMLIAGGFTLSVEERNPTRWVDPPRLCIDPAVALVVGI